MELVAAENMQTVGVVHIGDVGVVFADPVTINIFVDAVVVFSDLVMILKLANEFFITNGMTPRSQISSSLLNWAWYRPYPAVPAQQH